MLSSVGGGVALPGVPSGVGVSPFQEQLEDQYAQPEAVVVLIPVRISERHTLQIRRRVFGLAHRTSVNRAVALVYHLKRVGIYESYEPIVIDQKVGFVDVAYDVVAVVDGVHHYRKVDGDGAEVLVGVMGGYTFSCRRVEALVQLTRSAQPVHEVADYGGGIAAGVFA